MKLSLTRHVAAAVAVLAVLPAAASAARMTAPDQSLLARMNAVRAAHGLRPLADDTRLQAAAQLHSREMLASGVFAHGAFRARMGRFSVGPLSGENLAWGVGSYGTSAGIVNAWLRSPAHRANLLRPSFRRVGIANLLGRFEGYAGAHVVTADFAG